MNFIDRYFTSNEKLFEKGINFLYGLKGLDVNIEEAFNLISLCADRGYQIAIEAVNEIFDNGTPRLSERFAQHYPAIRKIKLDAQAGIPKACFDANFRKLENPNDTYQFNIGLENVRYAAAHEYPPALYELGRLYYFGIGVEIDEAKGRMLLRRAAQLGMSAAISVLYKLDAEGREEAKEYAKQHADSDDVDNLYVYANILDNEDHPSEALPFFQKAADKGLTDAMDALGCLYVKGRGCEQDFHTAYSLFQQASDGGNLRASLHLATFLTTGPEEYRDPEAAFNLYLKLAQINPSCWNYVGDCYKDGCGVEKSVEKARDSYEKALGSESNSETLFNLYQLYFNEELWTPDYEKGMEYLHRSAETGYPLACWHLGVHYKTGHYIDQNLVQAHRWFKVGSDSGNSGCIYELAQMYIFGVVEEKDEKKGFEMLRQVSKELPEAMNMLGICYSKGIGCPRNHPRAFRCYQIAAQAGEVDAIYHLAVCYRYGEGVPQDFTKAVELYEMAIAEGHPEAMSNCGILYNLGMGVEQNLERAFELFQMAAERDNCQGQFLLGQMYFDGDFVEQDYEEAIKWFEKAAKQGEPDSLFHLGLCYFEGLGVEQDSFKAVQYLFASADRDWQPAIDYIVKNQIPRP